MKTLTQQTNHRAHLAVFSIGVALVAACTLTAQEAVVKNTKQKTHYVEQLKLHSPYSVGGSKIYTNLVESPTFDSVFKKFEGRCADEQASALDHTHHGSLLSLLAWNEKDLGKQIELAKKADAAFDRAIDKSPHFWDAWMGKAEIYAHSDDSALLVNARSILTELTSAEAQHTTPAVKTQYASTLLNSLSKK